MKSSEKMINGLTELLDGFVELSEKLQDELGSESEEAIIDEDGNPELSLEVEAALVTEVRAAIEMVMDAEDISSEQMATFISAFSDALEEIDPDVFEESDEDEDEVYEDDTSDLDEDYLDDELDDEDLDDYDDEDEVEEENEEDEEE